MSTASYALRDSTTMLRRDIRHSLRYPTMTVSGMMVPIFLLLHERRHHRPVPDDDLSRTSVLTGQVLGSLIRTMISGALVVAVALGLGFRPSATAAEWVAAAALFAMLTLSLTWLTISFGLLTKTPAGANSLSLIPQFLPFISSAFVPTDSMPAGVRWFAQNQPFTPIIDTLRGLLTGTPIGSSAVVAVAWCVVLTAAGYVSARALYNRYPNR